MRFIDLAPDEEIEWPKVIAVAIPCVVFSCFVILGILSLFAPVHHPVPVNVTNVTNTSEIIPSWMNASLKSRLMNGTVVEVNPTPPPKQQIFNPYLSGVRNMSQDFSWHRENVSGYKDMNVNVTVWGWSRFHQVKYYSDFWGKYIDQFAPEDKDYLFVYVAEYMDGPNQSSDPRMWAFGSSSFRLQYHGYLLDQTTDIDPVSRVKELENTPNFNNDSWIRPFDTFIEVDQVTGARTPIDPQWIRMGRSNARNGYLVFLIDHDSDIRDYSLNGNFASFGTAAWRLS